jgi:GABA permease
MPSKEHNVLVIANETIGSDALHEAVRATAAELGSAHVAIVAPALNSRIRHWISDEDEARRAAERRLSSCLDDLRAAGVDAEGWVGDADPLQAIADALAIFAADGMIIATHPRERSNWLEHDLVGRARRRFPGPIAHVVAAEIHRPLSVSGATVSA